MTTTFTALADFASDQFRLFFVEDTPAFWEVHHVPTDTWMIGGTGAKRGRGKAQRMIDGGDAAREVAWQRIQAILRVTGYVGFGLPTVLTDSIISVDGPPRGWYWG